MNFSRNKIFNLKVCRIKPFISGFGPNPNEHWAKTGRLHCLLHSFSCGYEVFQCRSGSVCSKWLCDMNRLGERNLATCFIYSVTICLSILTMIAFIRMICKGSVDTVSQKLWLLFGPAVLRQEGTGWIFSFHSVYSQTPILRPQSLHRAGLILAQLRAFLVPVIKCLFLNWLKLTEPS